MKYFFRTTATATAAPPGPRTRPTPAPTIWASDAPRICDTFECDETLILYWNLYCNIQESSVLLVTFLYDVLLNSLVDSMLCESQNKMLNCTWYMIIHSNFLCRHFVEIAQQVTVISKAYIWFVEMCTNYQIKSPVSANLSLRWDHRFYSSAWLLHFLMQVQAYRSLGGRFDAYLNKNFGQAL